MVFAVLGVVGRGSSEVRADRNDHFSGQSSVGDLGPHKINSRQQVAHQRDVAPIMVTVGVKATDRQVRGDRQSRLEASDRDHRLPL